MKILYLDCHNGASGDMILGSLLDAGLCLDDLTKDLKKLKISGYKLKKKKVKRCGIQAMKFCVQINRRTHFDQANILSLIEKSSLKPEIKTNSAKIFQNLFTAERKIHGKKKSHLHELGDLDSIIDIVGACIGFDKLGIEKIYSSSVPINQGSVKMNHGIYPLPAPATLELIKNMWAHPHSSRIELLTPTGAAIIATLTKQAEIMPEMKIESVGYGAGSMDLKEQPNILRSVIGQVKKSYQTDKVFVIQTNIDDMSPLGFETLYEELFEAGAKDVTTTPIYMKKSRPAIMLTVIVDKQELDDIISIIFNQTTSFGLRYYEANRKKLTRRFIKVKTKFGPIKLKIGETEGIPKIFSPEYEDCKRLARKHKIPLMKVYEEAKKYNIHGQK